MNSWSAHWAAFLKSQGDRSRELTAARSGLNTLDPRRLFPSEMNGWSERTEPDSPAGPRGTVQTFEKATAHFEVNPNAMLVTPHYVYAGSLGNGLYVYDRDAGRWTVIMVGCPR